MATRYVQDAQGRVVGREAELPDGSVQVFDRQGRYLGRATRQATFDRNGLRVAYGFAPGVLYADALKSNGGTVNNVVDASSSSRSALLALIAADQLAKEAMLAAQGDDAPQRVAQRHAPLDDGTTHSRFDGPRFQMQRIHDQIIDELHDRGYEYARHHDEGLGDGSEFSVAVLQRREHPGVDPVLLNYWSGPAQEAGMTDANSSSRSAPAGLVVVGHPLGRDEYCVRAVSGAVVRILSQHQASSRS